MPILSFSKLYKSSLFRKKKKANTHENLFLKKIKIDPGEIDQE